MIDYDSVTASRRAAWRGSLGLQIGVGLWPGGAQKTPCAQILRLPSLRMLRMCAECPVGREVNGPNVLVDDCLPSEARRILGPPGLCSSDCIFLGFHFASQVNKSLLVQSKDSGELGRAPTRLEVNC